MGEMVSPNFPFPQFLGLRFEVGSSPLTRIADLGPRGGGWNEDLPPGLYALPQLFPSFRALDP